MDEVTRIAEFWDRFGRERDLSLPPLENGVGSIQRGSAVVTIHVLEEKGVMLVLARVVAQPNLDEVSAKKLLVLSFVDTGDAAFALHPQTGDLYLRALRGLEGLDYEEFEDLVDSVARTADHWDDKLARELAGA